MDNEPAANPSESSPADWPELSLVERRLLGVLIEKAKTTPDAYPLSANALITGANQKSNRDPIMNLTEVEVDDCLTGLQKKGLAIKITGGRVVRWRHALYEAWKVDKVELAILGELLLRGPQTEGELRGRASRMEPVDDLDTLRARLRPLTERRLVVYLTPEARRGAMLTHGFHHAEELERLRRRAGPDGVPSEAPIEHCDPRPTSRLSEVEAHLADTQRDLDALTAEVATLRVMIENLAAEMQGRNLATLS